jgi:hypothetical protein
MNAAKEMLLHLHNEGEILLAAEIRSFAVSTGWKREDAEELGALAQQIGIGKQPRIDGGPWWKPDIIEILKKDIDD